MSRPEAVLVDPARETAKPPSSGAAVRRGYLDQALVGYTVYGVGAVTAFLAVKLALSDAEAGLHSSALAIGLATAGVVGHRVDQLIGMRLAHFIGVGALGLGAVALMLAPAHGVSLGGAVIVGLGTGVVLGHINQVMSAGGGGLARVRLARATLMAMLASVTVPLFIAIGVASGVGWELVFIPGLVMVGLVMAATVGFEPRPDESTGESARLPHAFWVAWSLVILFIAIEFAAVFWAGVLIERQASVTLEQATLGISAFVAGIIAGRSALALRSVSDRDPIWLMRGGLVAALVGLMLPWLTASFEVAMLGMFIAGAGLGLLYPLGAAVTLATVPDHAQVASSRLVLASGLAILISPLILGVVADSTGVEGAWLLIPAVCVAGLLVTVPVGRQRAEARR